MSFLPGKLISAAAASAADIGVGLFGTTSSLDARSSGARQAERLEKLDNVENLAGLAQANRPAGRGPTGRPKPARAPARLQPSDWVDAGFKALLASGPSGLRIEAIARDISVSKGSFYWHFRDLSALQQAMLEAWVKSCATRFTGERRSVAQAARDQFLGLAASLAPRFGFGFGPEETLAVKETLATKGTVAGKETSAALDCAMRDWARSDPNVAQALSQIDRLRLSELVDLLQRAGLTPDQAAQGANVFYAGLLGVERLAQSTDFDTRAALTAIAKACLRPLTDLQIAKDTHVGIADSQSTPGVVKSALDTSNPTPDRPQVENSIAAPNLAQNSPPTGARALVQVPVPVSASTRNLSPKPVSPNMPNGYSGHGPYFPAPVYPRARRAAVAQEGRSESAQVPNPVPNGLSKPSEHTPILQSPASAAPAPGLVVPTSVSLNPVTQKTSAPLLQRPLSAAPSRPIASVAPPAKPIQDQTPAVNQRVSVKSFSVPVGFKIPHWMQKAVVNRSADAGGAVLTRGAASVFESENSQSTSKPAVSPLKANRENDANSAAPSPAASALQQRSDAQALGYPAWLIPKPNFGHAAE